MSGAVKVRIARARGSTPREEGAEMLVTADAQTGSIGGGALEYEALRLARDMLASAKQSDERTFPLGPALGQCCGGSVVLSFVQSEALTQTSDAHPPLVIWGAGHVGRAIARTLAPLADRDITLVDDAPGRLPDMVPETVAPFVAKDMPRAAAQMPKGADHLILTYSHEIDLALCHALLKQETGSIGLIGSETKWTRFQKRLTELGHSGAEISRITCPIGDPATGKHPQAIAISVASSLLMRATSAAKLQRTSA